MDKLNFGYAKPYVIPAKSPEDADEPLKKNIEEAKVSLKKGYCRFLLINLEYKTETIIIANIMTKMMIILKKRTSNDLKLMEMDFKW